MSQHTYYKDFFHYIKPDEPVAQKFFFNLHIYSLHEEKSYYLAFSKNGEQNLLASRVLPGDTLVDAISEELKSNLGVTEWDFFGDTDYVDEALCSKGKKVPRVDVYVAVPYFDASNKQVAGMTMEWQPVTDEASSYEFAYRHRLKGISKEHRAKLAAIASTNFGVTVENWDKEQFFDATDMTTVQRDRTVMVTNKGLFIIYNFTDKHDNRYKLAEHNGEFNDDASLVTFMQDAEHSTVKDYEHIPAIASIEGYTLYKLIPHTVQGVPAW